MTSPNYRTLESLKPYDDIEDLNKVIGDIDAYNNKLELFIEQDNDILDAYDARCEDFTPHIVDTWCKDWWNG